MPQPRQQQYAAKASNNENLIFWDVPGLSEKQILAKAAASPGFARRPGEAPITFSIATAEDLKPSVTFGGNYTPPRPQQVGYVPTKLDAQRAQDRARAQAAAARIPAPVRMFEQGLSSWTGELGGLGAGGAALLENIPRQVAGVPTKSNPITVGTEFNRATDELNDIYEKEHPWKAAGAKLLGVGAGALAGMGPARVMDLQREMAVGAARGGLEGLGEGKNIAERGFNALRGAAVGAAMAPAKEFVPFLRVAEASDSSKAGRTQLELAGLLTKTAKAEGPLAKAKKAAQAVSPQAKEILGAWIEDRINNSLPSLKDFIHAP